MRSWTARHWLWATIAAVVIAAITGTVAGLIPNPLFTRMIEAPWWSYPVWLAAAVLSGLLVATYAGPRTEQQRTRRGVVGTVLSFLAIGCPTCNKLVVLALGTNGALNWFGPVQPVLAIGSLALLGFALRARLRTTSACPSPVAA